MRITAIAAFFILLLGCAQAPDTLESPRMVIRTKIENDRVYFIVNILAGIRNRSSDKVIRKMDGVLVFREGNRPVKKTPLTAIPFSTGDIFPFETTLLRMEARGNVEDGRPLLDLFKIDQDEIVKAGKSDDIYIDEKFIALDVNSFKTEKIYSVLKGNSNAKNK